MAPGRPHTHPTVSAYSSELSYIPYLLDFSACQILVPFVKLVMQHREKKYQSRGADAQPRSTGQ